MGFWNLNYTDRFVNGCPLPSLKIFTFVSRIIQNSLVPTFWDRHPHQRNSKIQRKKSITSIMLFGVFLDLIIKAADPGGRGHVPPACEEGSHQNFISFPKILDPLLVRNQHTHL